METDGSGRLRRVKLLILALALGGGAAALAVGPRWAAGVAAGGLAVLLNLVGTERATRRFVSGHGAEKVLVGLLQTAKLGLTAAALAGLAAGGIASPVSLLLGVTCLPAALAFDIFLFPVNKDVGKKEP